MFFIDELIKYIVFIGLLRMELLLEEAKEKFKNGLLRSARITRSTVEGCDGFVLIFSVRESGQLSEASLKKQKKSAKEQSLRKKWRECKEHRKLYQTETAAMQDARRIGFLTVLVEL